MSILGRAKRMMLEQFGRTVQRPVFSWTARGHFQTNANIIYYHGVWPRGDSALQMFGGMELAHFANELRALDRFFDFVSLEQILRDPRLGSAGRPVLALTFDDGFDLSASGATDVLDELGIAATVFVNTASVRYDRLMWQHQLSAIRAAHGTELLTREMNELQRRIGSSILVARDVSQLQVTQSWPAPDKDAHTAALWDACGMPDVRVLLSDQHPYFDWDGLRKWIARGHAVGFHTHSHPYCPRLEAEDIGREIVEPVAELRSKLGLESVPFAYPFGGRLPAALEAAVASTRTFSCLLGIGRFSPHTDPPGQMDRVGAEEGIDSAVFGRPLLKAARRTVTRQARA